MKEIKFQIKYADVEAIVYGEDLNDAMASMTITGYKEEGTMVIFVPDKYRLTSLTNIRESLTPILWREDDQDPFENQGLFHEWIAVGSDVGALIEKPCGKVILAYLSNVKFPK